MKESYLRLLTHSTRNTRRGAVARHILDNNRNAQREEQATPLSRIVGEWEVFGENLDSYSHTFFPVVSDLVSFLKERSKKGNRYILDLMADEAAVRDAVKRCGYRGGLAVSLGFKSNASVDHDGAIGTVNGDLLQTTTWKKIEEWVRSREIGSFDTIVSRPHLGNTKITADPRIHQAILRRTWELLSPNNGVLLFQTPKATFEQFQRYAMALDIQGAAKITIGTPYSYAEYGRPVIMVKTPNSPAKLPYPMQLGLK